VVAHDRVEAELGEGVDDDRRGGLVVVRDQRAVERVGSTEQQLVRGHVERWVEDRLPGYEDF
jgi:hypothetical protein